MIENIATPLPAIRQAKTTIKAIKIRGGINRRTVSNVEIMPVKILFIISKKGPKF
jgi:hypothetical protein